MGGRSHGPSGERRTGCPCYAPAMPVIRGIGTARTSSDQPGRPGLRLVMVARAGLGSSTRNPGRTVVDDSDDLLAVADALELERATLLGVCVGAGSTLAFAARHPERTRRLAAVSTMAPLSGPASDAYLTPNLLGVRRVCRVPFVARLAFGWQQRRLQRDPEGALARALAAMPGPDAALARDPRRLARSRIELREMFAQPFWSLDEWRALYPAWPFLTAIRAPVEIWHGAQDATAPVAMAHWLASMLPDAHLAVDEDVGHVIVDQRWARIVGRLVA